MATFLFLKPEELGLDPTVTAVVVEGKQAFVYEITDTKTKEKHYFRTIETLSEYRSNGISGRKTRVWKVKEVVSPKDPLIFTTNAQVVVMKDIYLDDGALTEREIQDEFYKDVDALKGKQMDGLPNFETRQNEIWKLLDGDTYKQHFLTILHDHTGFVSKSVADDSVADPTIFQQPDKKLKVAGSPVVDRSRSQVHPGPTQSLSEIPTKPQKERTFVAKRQYRVVFRECCVAMHRVIRFQDSMEALRGAVLGMSSFCSTQVSFVLTKSLGLAVMFLAGWIHRDISSGNILWYSDQGRARGLLSDLEYAKRFPSNSTSASADPKTVSAACIIKPHDQIYTLCREHHILCLLNLPS